MYPSDCGCKKAGQLGFVPAAAAAYGVADKLGITDGIGDFISGLFKPNKVAGPCRGAPTIEQAAAAWENLSDARQDRHIALWLAANRGKMFPTDYEVWVKTSMGGDDCVASTPEGRALLADFNDIMGTPASYVQQVGPAITDAARAAANAARDSILQRVATSDPVVNAQQQYVATQSRQLLTTLAPAIAIAGLAALVFGGRRR